MLATIWFVAWSVSLILIGISDYRYWVNKAKNSAE
jgi:hypothetical protein